MSAVPASLRRGLDRLAQSVAALRDHRLRTALSVLGIAIGIAAVMTVSTISRGGNHLVFSELETFGLNSIWVYRDEPDDSPFTMQRVGSGIERADLDALRRAAGRLGIARITPLVYFRGDNGVRRNGRFGWAQILGVGVDYGAVVNDAVRIGRALRSADIDARAPVAVIGPELAEALFDDPAASIGETVRLAGRRLTVVGVLAAKSRDFLSSIGSAGGENANDRLLVPFTWLQSLENRRDIDVLQIEVASFERAAATADAVRQVLSRRHDERFAYGRETMAQYIATTDTILGGVAIVGTIAASISLLVGGMGIMNMMGTSVLERTREIGLMKAIGARERDVLAQFLIEAALISLIGGLLGLAVGGGASVVLAWWSGFPLLPSPLGIMGALLASVGVGLLSGWLPARRAARMRPVEALRAD